MASELASMLIRLLISVIIFQALGNIEAQSTIALGSYLYANDDNSWWTSPSGDFAIGFRHIGNQEDQFFLAIWFAKIPDKTVVWFPDVNIPIPRGSKVELTFNGQLVIQAPGGSEIWSSKNNYTIKPLQGAMLNTGNFRITGENSTIIWESFKLPANTILPTQVLELGDGLSSSGQWQSKFLKGRFEIRLRSNQMVMQQIDVETDYTYGAYFTIRNVSQLIFDVSGLLSVNFSNGGGQGRLTSDRLPLRSADYYHRVTLDFDGTLTQYIHPRNPDVNDSWTAITVVPDNICNNFLNFLGSGVCGYNSYCEIQSYDNKPNCGCPPGFSMVDPSYPFSGCKQDGQNYLQECNQGGSITDDRFDFLYMDGADWPFADYELLSPASESDCKISCASDCFCAVAIFQDPRFNNGTGNCWKKKLPLSNGRLDRNSIDRRALFKVLKTPPNSNSTKDRKNQAVIILAVLLGTSGFFNIFSIAAIFLMVYFFIQRRLYDVHKVTEERDYETNLRFYSYKELEKATNNFKEIVGRGAFGNVYKGLMPSSGSRIHISVKALDKVIHEGEKEFASEVNVIGKTHHKNLVRLLGYCNEGDYRLLVYEFVQNGALSNFLFGDMRLSWNQRVQIASGIARGLMYLHEECSQQIIHCDIKPQNILLDDYFTAKISDFGLAKLMINNQSQTLTGIRGTKGYVAPEWFKSMPVTVKVDVYSFGVMLLEIICCRKCVNFELQKEAILTEWAYECYSRKEVATLVEEDEEARSDLKKLEKLVMVAMWCLQDEPAVRPSMRTVTLMLEGILEVPAPPCPFTYNGSSVSSSGLDSSMRRFLSSSQSIKTMKISCNSEEKLILL